MTKLKLLMLVAAMFCAASVVVQAGEEQKPSENPSLWANVPAPLKKARWIWPNNVGFIDGMFYDIVNVYAKFREKFELTELPKKAPLYITADQSYRLYINGKFVASGPARGYQHSQPFDEIDVAKYLKKGKNIIAIRAYNVGRSTFAYLTQGCAGLIFALDLGNGKLILSNKDTKMWVQVGCERDTLPISNQMNNQEHIDLRIEDPAWITYDYDDSSWVHALYLRTTTFNAMPYYQFESRMIPMLEEFEIKVNRLMASGSGSAISEETRYRNVAQLFIKEKVNSKDISQNSTNVSATVTPSKKGEFKNFLFDFGKVVVGYPILKIDGAKGGEIVDIYMTELHKDGVGINTCGSNLMPAHRLICREGSQEHQFFQLSGLRYITVRVRCNPHSTLTITPSLMWSAYPLKQKGKFKTSNALVNKIWEACKQTQKVCSLDAYVDTPFREQAQWWGDARVQAWNTFFLSGDTRLLRRGIRQIAMQKVPNGLTYGHAPTKAHSCILPDFSLIWIITLWDYYWQTGEIEQYLNHRDTVMSILSYFDSVTDPHTGLVSADSRYWLFLDWTKLQKNGSPALLNLWLLEALQKMQKLTADNGLENDAKFFANRATKVRAAIEKNLVLPNGLLSDGVLPNGKVSLETSIHVQTLARITNINGFNFEKAKSHLIIPFLKGEKEFTAMPSSYWVVYVLQTMLDAGYSKEVYEYIKRNWKIFADYGTTFETFHHITSIASTRSHAWSAHPLFLLPRILGGVKQEDVAWKKVSFNPNYFEDFAEVTYPTPQGNIKVSWKKSKTGKYVQEINTPKNVEIVK